MVSENRALARRVGARNRVDACRRPRSHRSRYSDRSILSSSGLYIRRVRRNRFSRGLAGILSIWLAICLAAPMQLHTCVMHGGLAIDIPIHGAGAPVASSHAAHGGAASLHAMAGHSHHDQGTDGPSKQCSCLGDCSAGKTPVGPPAATTQLASLQVESPRAVFSYASPSLVSPHFLLPFSNGPPGASSRA